MMSQTSLGLKDFKHVNVFHISEVTAGSPVEHLPFVKRRKIRPVRDARPFDRFVSTLIVGDSLRDSGILQGDYAICKLNFELHELRNGCLVIARTPVGSVIKHFYLCDEGNIRLASANPDYPDLYFEFEDIHIEALVVRTEREWV